MQRQGFLKAFFQTARGRERSKGRNMRQLSLSSHIRHLPMHQRTLANEFEQVASRRLIADTMRQSACALIRC